MWEYRYTDELYHHGILGQKWGVRRYQNKDGSLTKAGKGRYSTKEPNQLDPNKEANISDLKSHLSRGYTIHDATRHESVTMMGRNEKSDVFLITSTKHKYPYDNYKPSKEELSSKINEYNSWGKRNGYSLDAGKVKNRAIMELQREKWIKDHETFNYKRSFSYSENGPAFDVYERLGGKEYYYVKMDPAYKYSGYDNKVKHSAIQPWSYHSPDELYHYGRLGMKWGVRLYQNKDGSLTALGKQRYGTAENLGRVMAAKQKAADFKKNKRAYEAQAKKNAKADAEIQNIKRKAGMKTKADKKSDSGQEEWTQPKKGKKISEMSNKEIQERINRIQLEKQLKREMASIQPETVSKGKQVVNAMLKVGGSQFVQNSVLNPLSKEIGKRVSEQLSGGKKEPTRSEILKKQAEDAMNEMKISNYRRTTIMNKQQIEAMRRDPNYVHAFDAADRKAVRKEDRKLNKELERTAQREKDKADLKANREKAKEKQREQWAEYEAKQAAEAKTREKSRELAKKTPTTGDDVYDRYLLKKNEEALKRYEEEERKRNRR